MKKIPLTQGKFALVDDEDYEWISQWKWYYHYGYAIRRTEGIRMHRVITNCPDNKIVDHINHNKLDNRRGNLRICDYSTNNHNVGRRKDNTSGVRGVTYKESKKLWVVRLQLAGRRMYIGSFKKWEDAKQCRESAEKRYLSPILSVDNPTTF